jgi:hypothetical protein
MSPKYKEYQDCHRAIGSVPEGQYIENYQENLNGINAYYNIFII